MRVCPDLDDWSNILWQGLTGPEGTGPHDVVTDGGKRFGVHHNRQGTSTAVTLGDWKVGRAVVCV